MLKLSYLIILIELFQDDNFRRFKTNVKIKDKPKEELYFVTKCKHCVKPGAKLKQFFSNIESVVNPKEGQNWICQTQNDFLSIEPSLNLFDLQIIPDNLSAPDRIDLIDQLSNFDKGRLETYVKSAFDPATLEMKCALTSLYNAPDKVNKHLFEPFVGMPNESKFDIVDKVPQFYQDVTLVTITDWHQIVFAGDKRKFRYIQINTNESEKDIQVCVCKLPVWKMVLIEKLCQNVNKQEFGNGERSRNVLFDLSWS